jgi:hypothetical protein
MSDKGSIATPRPGAGYFRSTPDNGQLQTGTVGPVGAKRGSSPAYSITSSADANKMSGTCISSALAVFRLIPRLNLVGCSTGRSAGRAPRSMRETK